MSPITMPTVDAGDRRAVEPNLQMLDLLARTEGEWLPTEETEERPIRSDHVRKDIRLNQPLLVIALGGTRRVIATGLKADFIEMYGSVPENVRLLAFDSANEPVDRQESRSGRTVRLEPEGEAWSYALVKRQIENHIRWLTGRGPLLDEINQQSGINVLVVGSIPGGQGAGSILDTAYLVRHVLENLGEHADASRIIGMLVLPGAFVGVHEGNLKPNAYAFAQELDSLMRHRRFEAVYPDDLAFVSNEAPFDQTIVLEGVDEQDHAEVCGMSAQSMVMLLGTHVGQKETMDAINALYALDKGCTEGDDNYLSKEYP